MDELVARPVEALNVEIKNWINPDAPAGVAKIARAALALRNRDGGFLIIGFDDKSLLPVAHPTDFDWRQSFHLDRIQAIVSKYASEKFEIAVGFGIRDGLEFPVIAIPSGVRTPVAARADLEVDGKKQVRLGEIYFRTLAANHRPSTAPAKTEDWKDIVEICFDNREADFGRFLRRQLGSIGIRSLINSLRDLEGEAPKSHSAADRAKLLLDAGEARRTLAISKRRIDKDDLAKLQLGSWSVALCFDPPRAADVPDQEFLSTLASSNPQYTGWPVWLDSRGFNNIDDRPRVLGDAWEALIVSFGWTPHGEFMLLAPKGEFYLHRILQDDITEKVPPQSALDPYLMLYRVAEVIAVSLAFGKALGFDSQVTRLAFAFRWDGLNGRNLIRWADTFRESVAYDPSHEDRVNTNVIVPLDTAPQAIAPYVDEATRRLFAAFGGHRVPMNHIEDRVTELVGRKRQRQ